MGNIRVQGALCESDGGSDRWGSRFIQGCISASTPGIPLENTATAFKAGTRFTMT